MEIKKKKGKEVREMCVLGVVMLCERNFEEIEMQTETGKTQTQTHTPDDDALSDTAKLSNQKTKKKIHKKHANKRKQENEMKRCEKTGEERWRAQEHTVQEKRDGN